MKITSLFVYALLAASISLLTISCTCHDKDPSDQTEKERNVPGKVPPSPDIPEPPRNTGVPDAGI
jgi:hypothetical protein